MVPAPKPTNKHDRKVLKQKIAMGQASENEKVQAYVSRACMTKFSALLSDLAELNTSEPDFRFPNVDGLNQITPQ